MGFGKSRSYIVGPAQVSSSGSAATSLVVFPGSGRALDTNTAAAGNYGQQVLGNAGASNSFGLLIKAGTNASDWAIRISNQANTADFLRIFGTGAAAMPASPLASNQTQIATGIAAFRTSDNTSVNNTLTADALLTLTFNETGHFALEIWLAFWEATTGTGGFQFDLNSGTSTVGGLALGVDGFSTAVLGNAGVTAVTTATAAATIATSSAAPSWFLAKGWANITGTGTLAVRWAQVNTSVNTTTLLKGSYFKAIKIG